MLLFVLFYVLFVCKCVLPPGDNPTAVNKYIISYQFNWIPHRRGVAFLICTQLSAVQEIPYHEVGSFVLPLHVDSRLKSPSAADIFSVTLKRVTKHSLSEGLSHHKTPKIVEQKRERQIPLLPTGLEKGITVCWTSTIAAALTSFAVPQIYCFSSY
jgi:hypothetical protein